MGFQINAFKSKLKSQAPTYLSKKKTAQSLASVVKKAMGLKKK